MLLLIFFEFACSNSTQNSRPLDYPGKIETTVKPEQRDSSIEENEATTEHVKSEEQEQVESKDITYEDAAEKLKSWFGHIPGFNRKFVEFLREKNINSSLLAVIFENKENFTITTDDLLKQFIESQPGVFQKALEQQAKRISPNMSPNDWNQKLKSPDLSFGFEDISYTQNLRDKFDWVDNMKKIEVRLDARYPVLKKQNKALVESLKSQNFSVIQQISISDQEEFEQYIERFLADSSILSSQDVQEGIKSLVKKYVREKQIQVEIVQELNVDPEIKNEDDATLLYSSNKLETWLELKVKTIKAYQTIEKQISSRISDSSFSEQFVKYLKAKKLNLSLLESFTRENLFSAENKYLESFASENKSIFNAAIYRKINLGFSPKIAQNLRANKAESKFSTNMIYDREALENFVKEKSIEICIEIVNNELEKKSADEKTYLQNNHCVKMEICNERKLIEENDILKELEPYIRDLKGKNDSNTKIKDEVDATIYDLVADVLKSKHNYSEENAFCASDYMRRTKKIEDIYNEELLFDEDKLDNEIISFIDEYERFLRKEEKKSEPRLSQYGRHNNGDWQKPRY